MLESKLQHPSTNTEVNNMTPSKTPPVPLRDFERISQSILGILIAENANITASCLFFGIIGESILNRHYKLKARAVVGTAAFNLTGTQSIAFATPEGDSAATDKTNFHCWVEVNGWFLDFSSLVFPEIDVSIFGHSCPRLMFQKPLTKASPSLSELHAQGSFYCLPNDMLTLETLADFRALQTYAYLIEVCTDWYRKPSKPMGKTDLNGHRGNEKSAILASKKFKGVWS